MWNGDWIDRLGNNSLLILSERWAFIMLHSTIKHLVLAIGLLVVASSHAKDCHPPQIYVDKGACPGEWCRFGNWKAIKDFAIYQNPKDSRPAIGSIVSGQAINALTAIAYVKPQEYILSKANQETELVWLLTYGGEGFYKVWRQGAIKEMELGFSPYGPVKPVPYEQEWWVQFQMSDGTIGWAQVEEGIEIEIP